MIDVGSPEYILALYGVFLMGCLLAWWLGRGGGSDFDNASW